jgi:hypothetical protein
MSGFPSPPVPLPGEPFQPTYDRGDVPPLVVPGAPTGRPIPGAFERARVRCCGTLDVSIAELHYDSSIERLHHNYWTVVVKATFRGEALCRGYCCHYRQYRRSILFVDSVATVTPEGPRPFEEDVGQRGTAPGHRDVQGSDGTYTSDGFEYVDLPGLHPSHASRAEQERASRIDLSVFLLMRLQDHCRDRAVIDEQLWYLRLLKPAGEYRAIELDRMRLL